MKKNPLARRFVGSEKKYEYIDIFYIFSGTEMNERKWDSISPEYSVTGGNIGLLHFYYRYYISLQSEIIRDHRIPDVVPVAGQLHPGIPLIPRGRNKIRDTRCCIKPTFPAAYRNNRCNWYGTRSGQCASLKDTAGWRSRYAPLHDFIYEIN